MTIFLSFLFGRIASLKWPRFLVQFIINTFVNLYNIDLTKSKKDSFDSLNEMFTREIKKDFNVIDDGAFIHPVEGKLVTFGKVIKGQTYLVKGKNYSVEELIGSSDNLEDYFFYNYYLSPQDYHRVHHPVSGVFKLTKFIAGPLYPVAPWFVNLVPAIFSKNARTVSLVESENFGPVYTVMVGALNVGSLRMLKGFFTRGEGRVKSGETLGVFELGSSVVVFTKKELSVKAGRVFFEEL